MSSMFNHPADTHTGSDQTAIILFVIVFISGTSTLQLLACLILFVRLTGSFYGIRIMHNMGVCVGVFCCRE